MYKLMGKIKKKDGKIYKEIYIHCGSLIEDAVGMLLECKRDGNLGFVDFNDHYLYSDTVTLDSAYMEIVGKTREEMKEEHEKWLNDYQKKHEEHLAEIPKLTAGYIKKGHDILDEKYWPIWDKAVPVRLADIYDGWELDQCLEIIDILNKSYGYNEAETRINTQGHSGLSYMITANLVRSLCDRGQEFFDILCNISDEMKGEEE